MATKKKKVEEDCCEEGACMFIAAVLIFIGGCTSHKYLGADEMHVRVTSYNEPEWSTSGEHVFKYADQIECIAVHGAKQSFCSASCEVK